MDSLHFALFEKKPLVGTGSDVSVRKIKPAVIRIPCTSPRRRKAKRLLKSAKGTTAPPCRTENTILVIAGRAPFYAWYLEMLAQFGERSDLKQLARTSGKVTLFQVPRPAVRHKHRIEASRQSRIDVGLG